MMRSAFVITFVVLGGVRAAAVAQAFLPAVYGTQLGAHWSGPQTCIDGVTWSRAVQAHRDDPNSMLDVTIKTIDSASVSALWAMAQQCVTNVPGVPDRDGAFVATVFAGKVIKMTYIFAGPGGKGSLSHWHDRMIAAHGPGTLRAGTRRWILDSLEVSQGLPAPRWQGGVPVQIRSRSGCEAVRAELMRLRLVHAQPSCW